MTSPSASGRLLLVPSPLDAGLAPPGPLSDSVPIGSIRAAARLTHWVVEDAKSARALLKRIGAVVPLAAPLQAISIVELPRAPKGARNPLAPDWQPLLAPLRAGQDVGLLSEAGLPAVADPGAGLIAAAHAAGVTVVSLAGASALTLALAASGLNGQSFAFVGYLPVDAAARAERLRELEQRSQREGQTQVVIETPYRNEALFAALVTHLAATTRLAISVGLTRPDGWSQTRSAAQWRQAPPSMPADVPAVFSFLAG